jgi:DNA-binding IclR family transcriptional regulator
MSNRSRRESGEFSEEVSDNDVLKVFDAADAPFLTAGELANALPLSRSGANHRLNRMREAGLVDRKETGARSVAWWATVAPRLSEESIARVERRREQVEHGEVIALDDL